MNSGIVVACAVLCGLAFFVPALVSYHFAVVGFFAFCAGVAGGRWFHGAIVGAAYSFAGFAVITVRSGGVHAGTGALFGLLSLVYYVPTGVAAGLAGALLHKQLFARPGDAESQAQ